MSSCILGAFRLTSLLQKFQAMPTVAILQIIQSGTLEFNETFSAKQAVNVVTDSLLTVEANCKQLLKNYLT